MVKKEVRKKFQKISKNFKKFQKISKNFKKFQKISKNFKKFQKISMPLLCSDAFHNKMY
jgi:protein subunit release factor A